jgi:hypothetical protein
LYVCYWHTFSLHVDDLKQQQPDTGPPIKAVPGTAAQPPTSMCCWWALLKEHHPPLRPHPNITLQTDQCLSQYISSSSQNLLSWIFCSSTSYFLFWIAQGGHSVIDGGWVISLSLSLSHTHTHSQLISSPHVNEWMKPGKVSFIFAVPKVKSINTGI